MWDLIIYHGGCADGLGGAWVFWTAMGKPPKNVNGHYDRFWAAKHAPGAPIPDVTNLNVVMVDFAYPLDIIQNMLRTAKHITILDHHKTSEELNSLKHLPNLTLQFDLHRSGTQLAWDFLHPRLRPRPFPLDHVADRDLWKWEIPHSKEVCQALFALGCYTDFETFDRIAQRSPHEYIAIGRTLLETDEISLRFLLYQAKRVRMGNYTVALLGCENKYISEAGSRLVEQRNPDGTFKYHFAAMWRYDFDKDEFRVCLRGAKDSSVDVEVVAKQFGGGGHKHSAAFSVPKLQSVFHYIS